MKKIILILLMLLTSAFAEGFYSYKEALEDAKSENKVVMVFLTQVGCPSCEYMKTKVFRDSEVEKKLSDEFIVVELDIHADNVPAKFKYIGTPTFYFVDKKGEIIDGIYGGLKTKSFLKELRLVSKK
jgi:thioredoxin-related protein